MIETPRLYLRDHVPDDADGVFVWRSDPEVMRFLGGVRDENASSVREFLESIAPKYARWHEQGLSYCAMGAVEKSSGELVGTALFKPLPSSNGGGDTNDLEIGWHLRRAEWGRGYATEMGVAMRDLAFETTAIDVVHAVVHEDNVASQRVAERVGLRFVERTDRYYEKVVRDYQITRDEWRALVGTSPSRA